MPLAFLALLLLAASSKSPLPRGRPLPAIPLSHCSGSALTLSNLTAHFVFQTLLPHPVTPPSPAGNPTPSPTALTTRSATSSRRPRPGPSSTTSSPRRACPELAEGRGPSGIQPPGRTQPPRSPLHTERTALFLPHPRAHRSHPFRSIPAGPNTPQTRQKSAPLHLKSFLEKTLTRAKPPHFAPPTAHPSSTVPNPAYLTAKTGDNQIAAPLPGRTR